MNTKKGNTFSDSIKAVAITFFFIIIFASVFLAMTLVSKESKISGIALAAGGGENETLGCREDLYECTEWGECTSEGIRYRTCELVLLCPDADNEAPYEDEPCDYFPTIISEENSTGNNNSNNGNSGNDNGGNSGSQNNVRYQYSMKCSSDATQKERIACRLKLSDSDIPSGINIAFMPEECRAQKTSDTKEYCIRRYSDMSHCFDLKKGNVLQDSGNVGACIRNALDTGDVAGRLASCKNNVACIDALRENVYSSSKFRIYALEARAELMLERGLITQGEATDIMFQLEQQILAFDNAPDNISRVKSMENAKLRWTEFIEDLKKKNIVLTGGG